MNPLLHIEDIYKDFEKDSQIIHALRGINLQISKEEISMVWMRRP